MKTKLTKLITILILSIITMNCKKSTEPLTLSDRAGTFTGNTRQPSDTIIGNPSSTATSITFVNASKNFTIDF